MYTDPLTLTVAGLALAGYGTSAALVALYMVRWRCERWKAQWGRYGRWDKMTVSRCPQLPGERLLSHWQRMTQHDD